MMNRDEWLARILSAVRHVASREFQERTWLGTGAEISSPEEVYNELFDDYTFDLFFEKYASTLTSDQADVWQELKSRMERYGEKMPATPDPRKVLDDPDWQEVRESAARFVAAFERVSAPQ
jgi:hypothetical protein